MFFLLPKAGLQNPQPKTHFPNVLSASQAYFPFKAMQLIWMA